MNSTAELLSQALKLHQGGHLTDAAGLYLRILQQDPQCADAWHLAGLVAYQTGRLNDAAHWIERAISLAPDTAVYHSNLAAVYKAQGRLDEAAEACRRALRIDPGWLDAHTNLGNILVAQGRPSEAVPHLQKVAEAEPNHVEGLINLGNALKEAGRLQEAAQVYERATKLCPNFAEAYNCLGNVLCDLEQYERAEQCFRRALELRPEWVEPWANLARLFERSQRWNDALTAVKKGLALNASHPLLHLVAARYEEQQGKLEDALARLGWLRQTLPPDNTHLPEVFFRLGWIYDKRGDVDAAFACFCEGNRLVMERTPNWFAEKESALATLESLLQTLTATWVSNWRQVDLPCEQPPVFLFGFPRSGTTLLDVILDSHPQVDVLEEQPAVAAMAKQVRALPGGYPAAIAELDRQQVQMLREAYFAEARKHLELKPGQIVLDKQPLNTSRAPLIYRVFPNAPMILAVRHPCDVCLSCFMRNFANRRGAMANFFTLADTAWFYARTMEVWVRCLETLPLRSCQVRYEDLLEDLRGQVARVVEFLGLAWHESLENYVETARQRSTRKTPNYTQITKPIYRSARYRWRRYRKYLEPIMPVLADWIEYFGYTD